jgi:penicillin-binding protein 2
LGSSTTTNGRHSGRFLPPDPRTEEPYRLTPALAVRIGILGVLALVVFGLLFLRLWALQVISGSQYLRAAQNNQLRTVRVQAPRGPILDVKGRPLVSNKPGVSVQIRPADLPKHRYRELRRLSHIVGVPLAQIAAEIRKRKGDPVTPVTVKDSVPRSTVFYLWEHKTEFPGVDIAQTYLRRYPYGTLAAHVLGFVGEISPEQLKGDSTRLYRLGDRIGQAGVEAKYDLYLRGQPGLAKLRVDSLGQPRSDFQLTNQPHAGYALRLTLDLRLQQAAERALQFGIGTAREQGEWAADGGAVVALDPRDGAIRAIASYPTYSPSLFAGRVERRKLVAAGLTPSTALERNYPALDRALDGQYPPGSTFKPVTALAAMQEHILSPWETLACTGTYTAYGQVFKNWDPYVNEGMTLPVALARSCDTYFYQLGTAFFRLPPDRGHPLQAWAARFGFGQRSGVDVSGEASGLLPTPEWRRAHFKTAIDRIWKPGDSIQLAIGQKDLLVTPLQMARFYALIANGGKLVTPHLAEDVEQPGDIRSPAVVKQRFGAKPPQQSGVDPQALSVVQEGLYDATHATSGTSSAIFGSFPISISGKTGTAEKYIEVPGYKGMKDQSWWCGYGPSDKPQLVVCVVIENGGHGGTAAAPAALKVFEQYFGKRAGLPGQVYSD